jgi:two-component system autoinducer 1 sensor kinase/phosphatase LuxN
LTDPNIKTHIKVKDFKVHAPYSLILHVFYNLFKNSFYFLKETDNPKINISSSNDGKYNIIHFRDNGLGIDSQNMKQLFQDFYSQRTGGVGLVLSFCNDVMRSLGGYIDCDSELNKYTQFNLFFPKVKKHVQ